MASDTPRVRPGLSLLCGFLLILGACTSENPRIVESQDTSTTTQQTTEAPTTASASSTTASTSTTAVIDLPGELTDFGPAEGDTLGVVGVAFNDSLNVRTGPGTDFDVLTELGNRSDDVIATGQNRLLPTSIWYEVVANDQIGWANGSFLGYLGQSRNGTLDFARWFGEDFLPAGPSMTQLGQLVADSLKSEAPPSRITIQEAPVDGEVVYDILDLGDDSVAGLRVTTIAVLTGEDDVKRRITRVDQQVICGRGVTPDGLCV